MCVCVCVRRQGQRKLVFVLIKFRALNENDKIPVAERDRARDACSSVGPPRRPTRVTPLKRVITVFVFRLRAAAAAAVVTTTTTTICAIYVQKRLFRDKSRAR